MAKDYCGKRFADGKTCQPGDRCINCIDKVYGRRTVDRTKPWDTAVLPQSDPNPPPVIRCVFGSDTATLNFHTEQEYREYEKNIRNAHMLAYHTMRVNYGIWAGNQNKYVQSVEELTRWDSGHQREAEYQEWLRNGGANA